MERMMSFRIAAAIMVLSSTTAFVPAWGQGRDLGTGAMARPGDYSFSGGAAVYSHVCQACHMPDGKGAVGAGAFPSLVANPKLEAAAYPVALILNGSKAMLPLGGLLNDQQIADVVNYIRSNFGNRYRDKITAAYVKAQRPE